LTGAPEANTPLGGVSPEVVRNAVSAPSGGVMVQMFCSEESAPRLTEATPCTLRARSDRSERSLQPVPHATLKLGVHNLSYNYGSDQQGAVKPLSSPGLNLPLPVVDSL
jgi:hypothetical protein